MPIVSSEIFKNHDRGNGSRRVFEFHTDHNGDVHEHRYYCPVDHDVDQALIDWVPKLEKSLIDGEKQKVLSAVEEGVDHARITLKHISAVQKAKQIIRGMMRGDPKVQLKSAQFVESLSNTQLRNHFPDAVALRIRRTQQYIINNQALFAEDIREDL